MKILEVKNLTKYYHKTLGVKDVNFSLEEGETFGMIGPNGAGKSTTIRAIMNLINKTEGEVYFKKIPLTKENIKLREEIGYLPGEVHLYEDLTVKQLLDYHESFYKKNHHQRRVELVKRLEVDETKKIEELSLGNLKKVGIILALAHEPKLLILDEATSGLDPIIQEEFFKILKEEKQKKTTILYSTHILNEISKLCDRVGIIKEGKLLKVETVKKLKENNLSIITITTKDINQLMKILKITPLEQKEDTIKFRSTMDMNKLLEKLTTIKIERIWIERPTLEEILLHYYK